MLNLFYLFLAGLVVLLGVSLASLWRYRERLHRAQGRGGRDPIRTVRLDHFDPAFRFDELGPTPAAEVRFIGGGAYVPAGTTDTEAWVLAVLAKRARVLFEFGTATGRTAYLWARNAPGDAEVFTLTLPPHDTGAYEHEGVDSSRAARRAREESRFTRFRYTGTDAEAKVRQLYGDSKALDETPWAGRCDLIFVDGSHAASYVESDSRKALRMLAPGGVVLWHDYRGRWHTTRDVYRVLNRLAQELPLVHLAGTSMIAYRAPE